MSEELVTLAKDKGFQSGFLCNTAYKYSTKESLRWYFWMCELQKWLLDTHKILVNPFCGWNLSTWGYYIHQLNSDDIYAESSKRIFTPAEFSSYEKSLEHGLIKSFELLK